MNWNGIISLLIACIEFLLLINLLLFVEKSRLNIIALMMITLLASYQALEFIMCQAGMQSSILPYFAFLVISFLPPLNLLLTLTLTRNIKLNLSTGLIFIPAISFLVYYTFVIPEFAVKSCTVLYATYHYPLGDLFGFFYYTPVLISLILLIRFVLQSSDKQKKLIAKVVLFGGVFISLPVIIGFILMFSGYYGLISAIESIMCKFAFVYALCFSFVCLYNSAFRDDRNYFKHLFVKK